MGENNMPTEVEKANQEAATILKKIRASGGKLQGNFYFVGKADGLAGGLVLTLAAKDKKGQKAKSRGKKLRAEIKGAKFAIGLAQVIDGKLTFILHGGTASKAHMKAGFKKNLSKIDGLKALLRVVFKKPETVEESEDEVEAPPEVEEQEAPSEEDSLGDVDMEELRRLEEEQAQVVDLSDQIAEFLSHDTELAEYEDQLNEEIENLKTLSEGDATPEEIQEARAALSKTMDVGQSLHVTPEQPLPPEITQLLNLSAQNIYESHRKNLKPTIDQAISNAIDFGGAQVQSLFADAENAALSAEYSLAVDKIQEAYVIAQEVLTRLPFALAFKTHHIAIEAALNIKEKITSSAYLLPGSPALPWHDEGEKVSYGSEVQREWDKVLEDRADRKWEDAKEELDGVIEYVERIKIALHDQIQENEQRAEESQKNMKAKMSLLAMASTPADKAEALRLLKEAALEELACAKEAKGLGVDPAIEMNIPYSLEEDQHQAENNNRPTCEEKFKAIDWFAIKDQFHAYDEKKKEYDEAASSEDPQASSLQRELVARDFMTQLWKYRQQYVETLINKLRKDHPNLIAKASGSTDLESDIDITFATAGSGEDVIAAKEFNQTILGKFSKPPGRTFDVNIYIREYGPGIKESFNEFHALDAIKDSNLDDSDEEQTQKLTQVDMDVATLLKQRRFLPQAQFNDLMKDVLDGMREEDREKVTRQYEEAESVYFETLRDKLDGIETRLRKIVSNDEEEDGRISKAQEALDLIDEIRATEDPSAFQKKLQETIESLENDFPDLTMEATDEMYLDRMGVVRENEQLVRTLMEDENAARELYEEHTPTDRNGDAIPFDEWKTRKLEALRVQIKKDIITNIVFANEAYMSEGAIKHVVQTGQARDKSEQEKLQIILDMPVANLVQSTNEQLADFFKDMAHSIDDVKKLREEGNIDEARRLEGEAYVHASKYVIRMLGAANALALKYEKNDEQDNLDIGWFSSEIETSALAGVSDETSLSDKIKALEKRVDDLLYQLRKSGTIPQSVKGEIAVEEIKTVFKITSIEAFTEKFRKLGVELNNAVRQKDDFITEQTVDDETVDDYILLREETDEEKGENILNKCCSNPLKNKKSRLKEGLILLGVDGTLATTVSNNWALSLEALGAYQNTSKTEDTQEVLNTWKTSITSISNSVAKNTMLQLHKQVLFQFDIKTIKLETGDNSVQKLFQKADLAQKNAHHLFYSKIPETLKQWVDLEASDNRVRVTNTRAAEKERLLSSCSQTSSNLKKLVLDLLELKDELSIDNVINTINEKITSLHNHRNRAIELQKKLLTHPLFPE